MSTQSSDGAALADEVSDRRSVSRVFSALRPEEWLLLAVLLASVGLCVVRGHGFTGSLVFQQYFAFFADKVLLVFAATRIAFGVAANWTPAADSGAAAFKRFLFGENFSRAGLLKTDLEVCRGLIALFCTLTVYTNVKLRIPLINPFVGDPSFQRIDDMIFGKNLWPWLERTTQANPVFANFLESVYFHDYFYFVLLVLLLYLRQDRLGLRWIFQAVCFTYILGVLVTLAYPTLGPCFVRREDYLWVHESMEVVGSVQQNLWRYFSYIVQAGRANMEIRGQVFMGIAAFPSLHVGHMAILTIVALRRYPIYSPLAAVMTSLTFVGTMAFGWHYAVDAFGGIALAWVVCALLWRYLPRWHERAEAS